MKKDKKQIERKKDKKIIQRPDFSQKNEQNHFSTNKVLWLEEYTSLKDFKKHHISETYNEKIAQEYVDWVDNNPNEIRNSKFYRERFIPRETFMRWTTQYGPLIEAHAYVYDVLADRREDLAVNYNPSLGLKIMPHYHRIWKEVEEWRAKIRSEANEAAQSKIVVLSDLEFKEQVESKNQHEGK